MAATNPMIQPGVRATGAKPDARSQLLEAASALMRERDTLDISLSEISTKAGLNSALVKYYFGNKEGLMRALLERDVVPGLNQLAALVNSDISPRQKMRIHIEGLINLNFAHPYLNRLLMRLIKDASTELAAEIAEALLKPITQAYAALIAEGVDKGDFKPMDAQLFYFNVIGACDPFFSAKVVLKHCYGIDGVDDALRRRYIAQTTETLLNGLINR
ncbi:TetR family transcriptional regulator [soil metagenome]